MTKKSVFLPLVISVSVIAGIFISFLLKQDQPVRLIAPQANYNKLNALLDVVSESYVDTIDKNEIIEQAIPSFMKELDPHSVYIPAKELAEMNEPLKGSFDGIGIQFNMNHDTLQVLHVISNGPSQRAGLMPGDQIITVDDTVVSGVDMSTRDVMKRLKGEGGSLVVVGINRKGNEDLIDFEIVRGKIPIYSVDVAYMVSNEIGYIKVNSFSTTTYQEFKEAITSLKSKGMTKLVLDLRSNTGGILDAATNMVDEFLPKNKMIVYTKGRKHGRRNTPSTNSKLLCVETEVAVLIDEFSASASEIVAGAIQDNDRGWIIGRRSFGKGLVQEPVMFDDGSAMRLTIARYYTPSGRCIQKEYTDDFDEYYSDIFERYAHGEHLAEDSVSLNDSLKYKTIGGRVVYGGGGIMPDIFVPIDTSNMNDLYYSVRNKNWVYEFAFLYTRDHRADLEKYQTVKSLQTYLENIDVFGQFVASLSTKDIEYTAHELSVCGNILKVQLYAHLARNILNDKGYYPIIHKIDDAFISAIQVLESDRKIIDTM